MVRVLSLLPLGLYLGSARPLNPNLGSGNDPAGTWLSYARFDADDPNAKITQMNCSWIVPELPATMPLNWAPWYGLQTQKGDGALIQPILDAQFSKDWVIYHAIYDWNNDHYETTEKVPVKAGDKITSSVVYRVSDNSYDMFLTSGNQGTTAKHNYKLKSVQKKMESTAYFVLEGGIRSRLCKDLPKDGGITFTDISLEVDGEPVASPKWKALQENPECGSKAVVVDSSTVKIEWNAESSNGSDQVVV